MNNLAETIKRLNELYHLSKKTQLSDVEIKERDQLRQLYLEAIKNQFKQSLSNVEIVDEVGNLMDEPH